VAERSLGDLQLSEAAEGDAARAGELIGQL
jgi:hypothetical protein